MKKILTQLTCISLSIFVLVGCGSSGSKQKTNNDLKKEVENKLDNNVPKENEKEPSTEVPKEVMSIVDAVNFLKAASDNKNKFVTISGYPRGTTKANDGEFMLYISDEKGTGLPKENFACVFNEKMKEEVRTHKAEYKISVSGTIGWNNGMIVLKNAKLAE